VGLEKVADFAIGDAEAMFEFAGHGEDDRTESIAGGPDGIRSLFGMASLASLATARTKAGFDVELGDDGHNGRQVGLVLHDGFGIDQGDIAFGTYAAGHADGAVDVIGRGNRAKVTLVSAPSTGLFLAFFQLAAAEVPGLPMCLSACLVEFLA